MNTSLFHKQKKLIPQININDAQVLITKNAFDFLKKSIDEIEEQPKYAVIYFANAVELILKARLMHEHWTLVVENVSRANKEEFLAGKCKTVNLESAFERLIDICGEKIDRKAYNQFKNLRDHRNRMIHFFHEIENKGIDSDLIENVVIEQIMCWSYLEPLLSKWKNQFEPFAKQISDADSKIKRNHSYIKAIFARLEPEIDKDKKSGAIYKYCQSCNEESAVVKKLSNVLFEKKCRICNLIGTYIEAKCPHECGENIHIESYNFPDANLICSECKNHITPDDLKYILGDFRSYDDYYYYTKMNCVFCNSLDSVTEHEVTERNVTEHDKIYVCTVCLSTEYNIPCCQWCDEFQMGGGDLEYSEFSGCEFCDGRNGWKND